MHPPGAYFFSFSPLYPFPLYPFPLSLPFSFPFSSLVPFFPFSHSTPFPFVPLALVPPFSRPPFLSSALARPLAVRPFPLPPCFPLFPLLTQTNRQKPTKKDELTKKAEKLKRKPSPCGEGFQGLNNMVGEGRRIKYLLRS